MRRLCFIFFILFIIAELAVAQTGLNNSIIPDSKPSYASDPEIKITHSKILIDSLKFADLIAEVDIIRKQLKAKSDTNQLQIDQLKSELSNAKSTELLGINSKRTNDSLFLFNSKVSTDAALARFKTKLDNNQAQVDQLMVESAKAKIAKMMSPPATDNTALVAQLKAMSDTNQAQIDLLKVELEKSKMASAVPVSVNNKSDSLQMAYNAKTDIILAQLKTKFESNQAQIDQLMVESAKAKIAKMISPPAIDNTALIVQLKTISDTNQAQIDLLKVEFEKSKAVSAKIPSSTAYDLSMEQLKIRTENNQVQIDQLIAELAKSKEEVAKISNSINSKNPATKTDDLMSTTQLKTKSDMDPAQIEKKVEPEKSKPIEPISKSPLVSQISIPTSSIAGFIDEKGEPATQGFYLVIGAFGNKENAEKYKAATIMKGHGNAKMIQNRLTKVYNVFVLKTNNRNDADAERIKYKVEYNSVWVLKLE